MLFAFLTTSTLYAAPKAELWPYWQQHNPSSETSITHQHWQNWLNNYVITDQTGYNQVAYSQVSQTDKALLEDYLIYLQSITISDYNRAEQKAFWINLYNAQTVSLILHYYPVDSITEIDISPGLFSNGPWQKKLLTIEKQALSLDDIEHRILRPIWRDARIHYAVNCASVGCPNLSKHAFSSENTEQLLEDNARLYINHPRGVRLENNQLRVSKIYQWFREDFGSSEANIIQHLRKYADTGLKEHLQQRQKIDRYAYDWSLNGIKKASQ